jgi:hypothetical protein
MGKIPKLGDIDQIIKREVQSVSKKSDGGSNTNSNLSNSTVSSKGLEIDSALS